MRPGDIVKKTNGDTFSNGKPVCTVLRVEGEKVYLRETTYWVAASNVVVVGRAFQPGDRVKLVDDGLFSNGKPVCTVKSVEGDQVEILETGRWATSMSLAPILKEADDSEVMRLREAINTLESTICGLLAIIRGDT